MKLLRRWTLPLLVGGTLLGWAGWISAQVTVPNTFTSGTTASASQVNANFSALSAGALNRTGGTITGNIAVDSGFTIDGVDISAVLGGGAITTGVATFTSTTAPQLNVRYDGSNHLGVSISSTGGVTFNATGSGAAFTFSDGVTVSGTLSATDFSCSGCLGTTEIDESTLTIIEGQITDGSLLTRIAGDETITGAWTFPSLAVSAAVSSAVSLTATGTGGRQYIVNSTDDANGLGGGRFNVYDQTAGANRFSITSAGAISLLGATTVSGALVASTTLSVTDEASFTSFITLNGRAFFANNGTSLAPSITRSGAATGVNFPSTSEVALVVGGTDMLKTTSTQVVIAGTLVPDANNTRDIGTSALRIATIYSQNALNTSDERAKRDMKPLALEMGIDFIDKLLPKEFYWREGKIKSKQLGFSAQDLLKLSFPGVDTSNPDSYLLNYNALLAPIVKGLQEVHAEIHEDRTIVLQLMKRIEVLEARLAQRGVED